MLEGINAYKFNFFANHLISSGDKELGKSLFQMSGLSKELVLKEFLALNFLTLKVVGVILLLV